ncbi:MAG: flavin reductase [Sulfobacillus thermosulfidooxidans]|nr:MAG: flavin reductase [Sulfobacillus thermosulfidooxidans]
MVNSQLFRKTMGHFATGVSVILAELTPDLHAMTANSLTSVSLDPPLILVSVDHNARMHTAMTLGAPFTVNILKASQSQLSTRFANPHPPANLFENLTLIPAPHGIPYLAAALAYIACRVEAIYPGGDHSVVLGRVEDMAVLSEDPPLLFYQGQYRTLESLASPGPLT